MADFFKKLRKEMDEGVTIASVKSKNLIETTKIRNRISSLQGQKESRLNELGVQYYRGWSMEEIQTEDVQNRLQTICENIKAIDQEIQLKEEEIEKIHKEEQDLMNRKKPQLCKCGQNINPEALFCNHCGAKVEEVLKKNGAGEESKSELAECSCGKTIREGTKFCGGCGNNVEHLFNSSDQKED
ncbi:Double zinc ribbon [Tindallia magadiensis]|uniref:Double zinc ribbon n=1 Tax=Tindallia magadiensis TaxID=69895 RepID=A0A1I3BW81_9FIRM|nr:zinc ribbon domain-containing protein [Tindallia magadiensis]SFH66316.1 Double zinc ribbon [Tindallia magadiensis]